MCRLREDIKCVMSLQSRIREDIATVGEGLKPLLCRDIHKSAVSTVSTISMASKVSTISYFENMLWSTSSTFNAIWFDLLELQGNFSAYGNNSQKTYNISGRAQLLQFLPYMLSFELQFRKMKYRGINLMWQPMQTFKHVVPDDSSIMQSCKIGDVLSVRELLRTRQASVQDVTPDNLSPLGVSNLNINLQS